MGKVVIRVLTMALVFNLVVYLGQLSAGGHPSAPSPAPSPAPSHAPPPPKPSVPPPVVPGKPGPPGDLPRAMPPKPPGGTQDFRKIAELQGKIDNLKHQWVRIHFQVNDYSRLLGGSLSDADSKCRAGTARRIRGGRCLP
jgi:hypothetical protein